jgi:hypothetical protein
MFSPPRNSRMTFARVSLNKLCQAGRRVKAEFLPLMIMSLITIEFVTKFIQTLLGEKENVTKTMFQTIVKSHHVHDYHKK